MAIQVVFKDLKGDSGSEAYIESQAEWQRATLGKFVAELLSSRQINHPDARRIDHELWSLWVRSEDHDSVNHLCYLAKADGSLKGDFEKKLLESLPPSSASVTPTRRLVIQSIHLHAVSIGKADPHIDPERYANGMDAIQRDVFLATIADIRNGRPSRDYSSNPDGSVSIQIDRPDLAYGFHISCTALWV